MNPIEWMRTVYLGDRSIESLTLDGNKRALIFEVDLISRVRSPDGQWKYYDKEDIPNGKIVLDSVWQFSFHPQASFLNDYISNFEVVSYIHNGKPMFKSTVSTGSIDREGIGSEVRVEVIFEDLYLIDPRSPDIKISN